MVFTYSAIRASPPHPPFLCYMGAEKFENEQLIRTGVASDIWFHVEDVSSAHVYLRLGASNTIDDISEGERRDRASGKYSWGPQP